MPHPASRHAIEYRGPAVNFFQGGVLGNGGLGAIVCTRPDALAIHFGHNDVWDIRISEKNKDKLMTFPEVMAKVQAIPPTLRFLESDPWYAQYLQMTGENYRKPYPRPMPCGSLVLGWDRRLPVDVLGHCVDPADGACTVRLLVRGSEVHVRIFVDMTADRLWISSHTREGAPIAAPFHRMNLLPDPNTPREFPPAALSVTDDTVSLRQVLPALEPEAYDAATGDPGDRAFVLSARVNGALGVGEHVNWHLEREPYNYRLSVEGPCILCVQLDQGLAADLPARVPAVAAPTSEAVAAARRESQAAWQEFWSRCTVRLADAELEGIWYRNLYFFRCAIRPGVTCPGLFANWSFGGIGNAWHGDYHMNYNTQQPFWVCFSSNHADLHEPYVRLVNDRLLPLSRRHAHDYYRLGGAAFPHSAYPVPMTMFPYPTPTWGWEIFETPWTVQSLWWHYRYTGDLAFLREQAFPAMKDATVFMAAYLERPEAAGPQWGDDRRHLFPTVSPEMNGGLRPGLDRNHDGLVDLALTRFLFRAYAGACAALDIEEQERDLLDRIARYQAQLPDYSTTVHPTYGEVFLDVPGGEPDIVFNTPNPMMTVFPAEEHGLHSPPEIQHIAANTLASHRNEGGNHLVFIPMQAARLGRLDLERFKRDVAFNTLPNGTCANKNLEGGGRYNDHTPFDYMANMGIWFENFALPAVVNEALLQSYTGEIRLFPNWPLSAGDAEFRTLRAVGAFLVSARIEAGCVRWIEVFSERGSELRLVNPWPRAIVERNGVRTIDDRPLIVLSTAVGERLQFSAE
ncbi:MAG: hypothetical protein LLG01_13835 [Planctomycetaceae bacterium]|nr:hypothetical protein [Planctomycetaceae bacterium]